MKKVLVLTLVLVMAFASSALAAVNFSGKFTATASQKNFKVFKEGYQLKIDPEFTIGIKASDKSTVDEEEVTNWDLSAVLKLAETTFSLGKYKLGLYDEWFTGYAWGNAQELSDKATYFGMITAPKAAPASSMRARLIVHVMDYADVTFDFAPQDNMLRLLMVALEDLTSV
jgi:opacity protein-like surface antigen